jgi:YHS domain-containing protein
MQDHRDVRPNEDPVCGMTVNPALAKAKGLVQPHDGIDYVFCGRGCSLDFAEDPERFLDPTYRASM